MLKKHTTMSYKKAFCALTRWCTGMIMGGFLVFGASEASAQVVVEGNVFGGGKGSSAVVTGNPQVTLSGDAQVSGNVFGGGDAAAVTGSTQVTIKE